MPNIAKSPVRFRGRETLRPANPPQRLAPIQEFSSPSHTQREPRTTPPAQINQIRSPASSSPLYASTPLQGPSLLGSANPSPRQASTSDRKDATSLPQELPSTDVSARSTPARSNTRASNLAPEITESRGRRTSIVKSYAEPSIRT